MQKFIEQIENKYDIREELARIEETLRSESPEKHLRKLSRVKKQLLRDVRNHTVSHEEYIEYKLSIYKLSAFSYLLLGKFDEVKKLAAHLKRAAILAANDSGVIYSNLINARLEKQYGNYQKAETLFNKCIHDFNQVSDKIGLCSALLGKASLSYALNDYYKSLEEYITAEKHIEALTINNTVLKGTVYSGISGIYARLKEYDKAYPYLQKVYDISIQENDKKGEFSCLCNMATIYNALGQYEKQNEVLQKAVALVEDMRMFENLPTILLALANARLKISEFGLAEHAFQRALQISQQTSDKQALAHAHYGLAQLMSNPVNKNANNSKAGHHYHMANILAAELGMIHFQSAILDEWATWAKNQKYWKKAVELLEMSQELEKSVINEETKKNIAELEVKYQVIVKEKENEILKLQFESLEKNSRELEKELHTKTQTVLQQLRVISSLKSDIMNLVREARMSKSIEKQVAETLKSTRIIETRVDSFLQTFYNANPFFVRNLQEHFPDLTATEIRVCILMKVEMKTEEIAQFMSTSRRGVESHRLRIRKKIQLGRNENLEAFISSIPGSVQLT